MRLFRFVAALCFFSIVGHTHAIASSSCALTDRAYERRVCLRIERMNATLSKDPSLARPVALTGAVVAKPKPLPAGYIASGIAVRSTGKQFFVKTVVPGSPADIAGILAGDELLELDGQPIKTNVSAAELERRLGGLPGTSVVVQTGRRNAGLQDIVILREKVTLEDAAAEMNGKTAYINVRVFSKDAVARVRSFLTRQADARNPRGVIIDLRDNPGGELDAVRAFLGLFLEERTVVARLQTPDAFTAVVTSGRPVLPLDTRMVLLVTKDGPPAVSLMVGAMKIGAGRRLTVIQSSLSEGRRGDATLRIKGKNGVLRDFTPPADALLSMDAEIRVYLDEDFVNRTNDEQDPAGTGEDPALDRALELLH